MKRKSEVRSQIAEVKINGVEGFNLCNLTSAIALTSVILVTFGVFPGVCALLHSVASI